MDQDVDYAQFSLDELQDALRHIDGKRYPERLERLKTAMAQHQRDAGSESQRRVPDELPAWLKKSLQAVQVTTIALALNNLFQFSLGIGVPFLAIEYWVLDPDSSHPLTEMAALAIILMLSIGGCALFHPHRGFLITLALAWLALALQIQTEQLLWSPTLNETINFSLKPTMRSGSEVTHGVRIVLIPLACAVVSAIAAIRVGSGPSDASPRFESR